jgi:hypothetical protein
VEEEVEEVQIEDDGEKEEEAAEADYDQQVWHLDEAGEKVCVGQEDIFSWIEAERAELERSDIFFILSLLLIKGSAEILAR